MRTPTKENLANIQEIVRVTWIGMAVNAVLSAGKIAAGVAGGSQVVVADGVHSISDMTTDVALLVGARYWSAPPDEDHPHGHSRIETIITAFIGMTLLWVAVGIGYHAISTMREVSPRAPGMIALLATLVSIVSKETLYQWTLRVGRRTASSAVIANAWHHRSDAISSVPAAIAVAGAHFLPGWIFLDHVGAVIVSIFILQAAWNITWPALRQLSDSGASPEIRKKIERLCLDTEGVLSVHKCRTRQLGSGLQVDIHLQVKSDITVREGHDIAGAVKQVLLSKGPGIVDVLTHVEPYEDPAEGSQA